MIKHTYFNPSKMWDEFSIYNAIYKTKIGPSWHGPSFSSWAELAWAEFYVGQAGMGRVGVGPSCSAPIHTVRKMDRQRDRETWVSARMYARMDGHIHANIQTSKLEVRS